MRYLLVTDFEATCWDDGVRARLQEIIEIGCAYVNPDNMEVVHKMSIIIKPQREPKLSAFCTELTGISQSMVDEGCTFLDAMTAWLVLAKPWSDVFCSWGAWDHTILQKQCAMHQLRYPFSSSHINIKKVVADVMFDGNQAGVQRRCNELGVEMKGQHHRGLDDVLNIISVMKAVAHRQFKTFGQVLRDEGIISGAPKGS